jgi:enoyl-CoA hydratase/carnithine racemase
MSYERILYTTDGAVATITLNRPEALNTIVPPMPDEVEHLEATVARLAPSSPAARTPLM